MITESDASGGLGSFAAELRGILTEGLRATARSEVIRRYGPGAFADLPTVAADGSVRHAGAPTPPPGAGEQLVDTLRAAFQNPLVVIVVAVIGAVVIARFVRA
ncbi:MAG: hypothetical protein ACREQZ_15720 [Woeseiaceae bacterium]